MDSNREPFGHGVVDLVAWQKMVRDLEAAFFEHQRRSALPFEKEIEQATGNDEWPEIIDVR